MHLYLIRHAQARPTGGAVRTDAERPLTRGGEQDAVSVGRVLAATDPEIGLILTSPLTRAVQTGDRIAGVFDAPPERRITDNLAPGFRPGAIVEEILAIGSDAHVILIGHQPDIGALLSRLVANGMRAAIAFGPGATAFLTATPMGEKIDAQLQWLLTPRLAGPILEQMNSRRTP